MTEIEPTTMTTKQYTAEDFVNAEFARHPDGRIAMRFRADSRPWRNTTGRWLSDTEMAADGWTPVREAAAHPVTLDALQAAWEGAEQAEECGPGDVVIRPGEGGRFEIIPVEHGTRLMGWTRILHRAPKPKRPEGAEAIEEALLKEWLFDGSDEAVADLADRLAARGVRMTEEGEK